jgi:hypothetical protein
MVECWVVVPRDAGSSPVFRVYFVLFFLGALTSKTYAFQYRTWELSSQLSVDMSDISRPLLKLQFNGSKLVRVLPGLDNSEFNWISDLTRFNLPFLYNSRSRYAMLVIKFDKITSYFFSFNSPFKTFNAYLNSFFTPMLSINSFFPQSNVLKYFKTLDYNIILSCFLNVRELSPSFITIVRIKRLTLLSFGSFFDSKLEKSLTLFFPANKYYSSFFSKSLYSSIILHKKKILSFLPFSVLNFNSSVISDLGAQNSHLFKNFINSNLKTNFLKTTLLLTNSVFPFTINSDFPAFFIYQTPKFFDKQQKTTFKLSVDYALKFTNSVFSLSSYKKTNISFFMPHNALFSAHLRSLCSPYSKLFQTRKVAKLSTHYV